MPCRVALYPQRWSLYLMGGGQCFAPQTKGKEWSNWGRSTSGLVSVIITIVPVIRVAHDPRERNLVVWLQYHINPPDHQHISVYQIMLRPILYYETKTKE